MLSILFTIKILSGISKSKFFRFSTHSKCTLIKYDFRPDAHRSFVGGAKIYHCVWHGIDGVEKRGVRGQQFYSLLTFLTILKNIIKIKGVPKNV